MARLRYEVAVVAAPREHLVSQCDVITVISGRFLLSVWPTGGAGRDRASRLEAKVRRAGNVDLNSAERLDLVESNVYATQGGWRSRVD